MTPVTSAAPIAIVGIGCAFPGARGPAAFWDLLRHSRSAIRDVPADRFPAADERGPNRQLGRAIAMRAGLLDELDQFDPAFFGISPREAASMDPQQRLLLEVAWEAIEDAGITRSELSHSQAAVYIGMSSSDYADLQLRRHDPAAMDVYTLGGTARSILAGRLSHVFDLTGPSMALDTACSSSLVAVHLACESIWNGPSRLALAGGANLILAPEPWAVLARAGILSPDGRPKVFDAAANGFTRGEGAGVVVLKPLAQAQIDGDPIYAVIRGSAINNDGRNSSIMTPNQQAQEAVLRAAYRRAGLLPGAVHYVEAHGTGTSVGDPIEARALGAVMGEGRAQDRPCLIGSAKANIGHLEAAAGIAGLIKAALCVKFRAIPPSLNFEEPNPAVAWDELPLRVQNTLVPWPDTGVGGPAYAGVSSFGISGTNVHVVMSDAPPAPPMQHAAGETYLLPLSAHTPAALTQTVARFHAFLADEGAGTALPDICYSAAIRRNHHAHRTAFVARSRPELVDQLAAAGQVEAGMPARSACDGRQGPVFVFSGQGARFWPLDGELMAQFPVFRATLERCADLLAVQGAGWSLVEQLTAADGDSRLHEAEVCQAAIVACQVALAALWRSWGIEPAAVIGHSLGEIAAAHVAGAISLEQAMALVLARGRITRQAAGYGAMALAGMSPAAAAELVRECEPAVVLAVTNSPANCVLSGDPAALTALEESLERRAIFVRRLPAIDYAAHSPQMEPLKHVLAQAVEGMAPQAGAIPFYSSVAGAAVDGAALHAAYWAANLREPVRFDRAVTSALAAGHRLFLEVHPTQVLTRPVHEVLAHAGVEGAAYPSLVRGTRAPAALLRTLGSLYTHGCPVRWPALYPQGGRHVALPPAVWQRQRFWLPAAGRAAADLLSAGGATGGQHPLLGLCIGAAAQPGTTIVQTELAVDRPAYLTDHRVYGAAVFPAAAYAEVALALAKELDPAGTHTLADLTLEKVLILPDHGSILLQVTVDATPEAFALAYFSSPAPNERSIGTPAWTLHARGTVRRNTASAAQAAPATQPAAWHDAAEASIEQADHIRRLAAHGLNYGAAFQGLARLWRRGRESLGLIELPEAVRNESDRYLVHPVLLDLAFQTVAAVLYAAEDGSAAGPFLPVALGSLHIYASLHEAVYTCARVQPPQAGTPQRLTADISLLDGAGRILLEAKGLVLQQLTRSQWDTAADPDRQLYHLTWQPQPLQQAAAPPAERWLIVEPTAGDSLGAGLAAQLEAAGQACRVVLSSSCTADELASEDPPHAIAYLAPESGLVDLMRLIQRIIEHGEALAPRLWIVTRGAQPVIETDDVTLDQAPLWGLARTVALEYPMLRCSCIDLDAHPQPGEAARLGSELLADGPENQVAYRGAARCVLRLVRYQAPAIRPTRPAAPGEAFRLATSTPGILDHLTLIAAEHGDLAPDEVEIRVHSAGLNFLDVLSALGLRPDQNGPDLVLGMECAGTVTRVGSGVTTLYPGDEVLAVAPHSIGAYTCTPAALVLPKPAGLSFQAAAAAPIAYLTAWYALHTLGRLRGGERILIHAAAGGVGLAAVHLAQRAGATIYATAGSPEKRAFLHQLGVAHVMDSRTLDFAAEIMADTHGEGVDLVLNSLAGEAIARSLALLRANGRFLEIGKRDIYSGARLDMGLLKRNISFHAIDLIPLLAEQPPVCREILDELSMLLAAGALPPLPYTEFPITEAAEAFRYMAQARHIGKVVIVAEPAAGAGPIEIAPLPRTAVRGHATYLITGGLGALGLCLAGWLVRRGARHVVLLGRRPPSADVCARIASWQAQGAEVIAMQADVADEAQMRAVMAHIDATLPPLRGVFHAAGVLDDGILLHMDESSLCRVMEPKARGAWLLHQLTSHIPLDLFVLFSSATSILGSPGQANYAAANAWLDALAHLRRKLGLPALAINWGAWAEAGMAAQPQQTEHLAALGILPFVPDFGLQLLERICDAPAVQITALTADWPRLLQHFPLPLLHDLAAETAAASPGPKAPGRRDVRAQLAGLAPADRHQAVIGLLHEQLAQVLRTPGHLLDPHRPLNELGIDSLMTVELVNRIEADLGVTIPLTALLQGPTSSSLASLLLQQLDLRSTPNPDQPSHNPAPDDRFAVAAADLAGEAVLDPDLRFDAAAGTAATAPRHIFLTGATGFLGAILLHDLLRTTDAQIHCLVRAAQPEAGRARLIDALENYFGGEQLPPDRIVAVPGDLALPHLGLAAADYGRLAEQIDLIVHSAAEVNWLAPYTRLQAANVAGTAAIIRLAACGRAKPLHYVSSLGVFPILQVAGSAFFDEWTPLDHGGILHGGYTQSKWVAEKLVAQARAEGLPATIYRPSLVAGHSRTGIWQGSNVVVNMLRSWIELGLAPAIEARFDLVAVDYVSQAITSLIAAHDASPGVPAFHLNNPRTVSAAEMVGWLNEAGYAVRSTPYPAWRRAVLQRTDLQRQALLDAVGPLLALPLSDDVAWLQHVPGIRNDFTIQALGGLSAPPMDASTFHAGLTYLVRRRILPPP